jgi:riboflavin-specific deaminase-like protein
VNERPYVLLSCAMSVDGCLDAPGPQRLVLSGPADADRVDGQRANSSAIMVGAGTIRRDNPRLLIRSPQRRAQRQSRGLPEHPARVTLTASGNLDPGAAFFSAPPGVPRLVYCPSSVASGLRQILHESAEVIAVPEPVALPVVLADLPRRGADRLMVEPGARLGAEFLAGGLADELELMVAPFFVGDPAAPRFAAPGRYPHDPSQPMVLAGAQRVDNGVLLRYLLGRGLPGGSGTPGTAGEATGADRRWLRQAIELSRRCPPSPTAFSVGAILVSSDGRLLAAGYSREGSAHDHAEEAALAGLGLAGVAADLAAATLYSSLEPCRYRASRPRPCAGLIVSAGLGRVVMAWREPPVFAEGGGAELLREAGVTVVEVPGLAAEARAVNQAVLPS